MDWITILGLTAATLTTISFIPQVLKSLKTKKTRDISLTMYIILTIGIILWFIYGIIIKSAPIIIANSITFLLTMVILVSKILMKD